MAGGWWRQARLRACRTGGLRGVGLAFAGAFDPRYALGQRLQVLTHVGQVASDLGKRSADFRAQALVVPAEFGSQGVIVGARFTPEGEHETNHGGAYGEDCDEFGGHGRRPGDGLCGCRA